MKLAQAVVSQTKDGKWKIFVQSDSSVEDMLVGSLEDIVRRLRAYSSEPWEQRS